MVEPHEDGRYSYGWRYDVNGRQVEGGPTKILEVVENSKLVTDWPDWRGNTNLRAPQRVTWTLEWIGEQTRVTAHPRAVRAHSGSVRLSARAG